MDKVTLLNQTSILSEVRRVYGSGEEDNPRFAFVSYPITSIISIFVYESSTTKLRRLGSEEYSINSANPMSIVLTDEFVVPENWNGVLSIEYKHRVAYNVRDIPHDVRTSYVTDNFGRREELLMPLNAVAVRSHQVMGQTPDFAGVKLLDNSYL